MFYQNLDTKKSHQNIQMNNLHLQYPKKIYVTGGVKKYLFSELWLQELIVPPMSRMRYLIAIKINRDAVKLSKSPKAIKYYLLSYNL